MDLNRTIRDENMCGEGYYIRRVASSQNIQENCQTCPTNPTGVCIPTGATACAPPQDNECPEDNCEFDYQLSGGGPVYNGKNMRHGSQGTRLSPENLDNLLQCDDDTIPITVKEFIDPYYTPCTEGGGSCDDWRSKQMEYNIREAGPQTPQTPHTPHTPHTPQQQRRPYPLGYLGRSKHGGFTKCVFEQLGIQQARETILKGFTSSDTFEPYHRIVNRLMNMRVSDLNGCEPRIRPRCNNGQGYSEHILSLPSVVIDVLTAPDDQEADTTNTRRGLREQLEYKIPLMMNNLAQVAEDYERGLPGCDGPSNKTTLIERIYGGTTISLDIGDVIKNVNLLGMSEDVITDSKTVSVIDKVAFFSMKMANFVAIAIVLYMFLKLLLA